MLTGLFVPVKGTGREAYQSYPTSGEVRKGGSIRLHGVVLNLKTYGGSKGLFQP
jgi:hypothetical protein